MSDYGGCPKVSTIFIGNDCPALKEVTTPRIKQMFPNAIVKNVKEKVRRTMEQLWIKC